SELRKEYIRSLFTCFTNFQHLWTVEFSRRIPHLNIIVKATNVSKPPYIRWLFVRALKKLGHPTPEDTRVYFQPVRNWSKVVNYIFKTKQRLPWPQTPPPNQSYRLWGCSRGFLG